MNQRTRVLTGLTAGVLAVSAMAFGFSKWSSEINLNGAVSANGKWDVAVTAASAQEAAPVHRWVLFRAKPPTTW